MKSIKLEYFLLFILLNLFFSCRGQQSSHKLINIDDTYSTNQIGKVVSKMGNKITHIFQDSQNNYWFGGEGVYRYDGESITQFSVNDGLCNNRIRGIQEDEFGNIYFDTGSGISKYDGQKFITLQLDTTASKTDWKMEPGDLWFAGNWNKNGPYRYDGEKLYHLEFPKHKLEDEYYSRITNKSFSPYEVYQIFKDNKGNIWFGTSSFGACRYDGESLSWISELDMIEMDYGPAPGVRSILEDKEGNLWFSSNINHKYKMIPASSHDKKEYEILKGIETSKESDLNNYFMSITQDDNGYIWMARYGGGVWKYDSEELIHYPIKDADTDVLIFKIYKDRQGDLWLGTQNAGTFKFNGESFERFNPIFKN